MKRYILLILVVGLVLVGCAKESPIDLEGDQNVVLNGDVEVSPPLDSHVCTIEEKIAEICTLDYTPVCGDDGLTYGNGCSACSSGMIEAYVEGECPFTE